jgi:hypothetical protein
VARENAIEPSRGHTFYSCNTLGLFGGGIYSLCLSGLTPKGATATATVQLLFGPWPDSSLRLLGVVLSPSRLQQRVLHWSCVVIVIIVRNNRSGDRLCHQVLTLAVAIRHKQTHFPLLHVDLAAPGVSLRPSVGH